MSEPQAATPPPPPPAGATAVAGADEPKASWPIRIFAVIAGLALLFGALVMVFVVINPDNLPLCEEVRAGEAAVGPSGECFDVSDTQYVLAKVFAAPAAVLAALAGLLGFYVAATGRRAGLMAKLAAGAIVLGVLAYVVDLV
jgi:hypothetical protein